MAGGSQAKGQAAAVQRANGFFAMAAARALIAALVVPDFIGGLL